MSISITRLKPETTEVDGFAPDRMRPGLSVLLIAVLCSALWYGIYAAMALLLG